MHRVEYTNKSNTVGDYEVYNGAWGVELCLQGVALNLLLIPLHQLWFMQPGHQLGVLHTHLASFRKLTTKPQQLGTHSCFSTCAERMRQDRKTSRLN